MSAGWFDRFVDLREPAIIIFVRLELSIRRERFPQTCHNRIVLGEAVTFLVIRQTFLRGDEPFIPDDGAIHCWEMQQAAIHSSRQLLFQFVKARDDALH